MPVGTVGPRPPSPIYEGEDLMKSILKSAMFASVAAMGLSLAACDSAAENKMEDDANATREAADEQLAVRQRQQRFDDRQRVARRLRAGRRIETGIQRSAQLQASEIGSWRRAGAAATKRGEPAADEDAGAVRRQRSHGG